MQISSKSSFADFGIHKLWRHKTANPDSLSPYHRTALLMR